ncbi:MAG TPA: hypothetical protein VKN99_17435 [Polyangia bacterium]|nr:hypothetical protein [Polyangia bacterium]
MIAPAPELSQKDEQQDREPNPEWQALKQGAKQLSSNYARG